MWLFGTVAAPQQSMTRTAQLHLCLSDVDRTPTDWTITLSVWVIAMWILVNDMTAVLAPCSRCRVHQWIVRISNQRQQRHSCLACCVDRIRLKQMYSNKNVYSIDKTIMFGWLRNAIWLLPQWESLDDDGANYIFNFPNNVNRSLIDCQLVFKHLQMTLADSITVWLQPTIGINWRVMCAVVNVLAASMDYVYNEEKNRRKRGKKKR